jgi:hypothetical protein
VEELEEMGEAYNEEGGAAHGDAGPDRRDEDVPVVEDSRHDGDDHDVVREGPEEVNPYEYVAKFDESHQRHYLKQVLGKDYRIRHVYV